MILPAVSKIETFYPNLKVLGKILDTPILKTLIKKYNLSNMNYTDGFIQSYEFVLRNNDHQSSKTPKNDLIKFNDEIATPAQVGVGLKFLENYLGKDSILESIKNLMDIPIYVYIIDYILGVVMYTLIGRSAMNIFQKEDSDFFFMKAFVKLTNPILDLFKFMTPSFLIRAVVPLYIAWFIFMVRFYLLPVMLGYGEMGMLSFPLDSEISRLIYDLFGKK